jgi:uncharacterized protein (TIGR03086 family)
VVQTQGLFLGFIGQELGDIPAVDDDPAGAWKAASAKVQANLDDPAQATKEYDGFAGKATFEQGVDRFLCTDLVVHGWDLARATGQDDTIQAEDLQLLWPIAQAIPEQFRVPGAFRPGLVVFGPQVQVAADAPLQHKILGMYGRDPAWHS